MGPGEKVLDPFRVQETYRRMLAPDQKVALDAEIRRFDSMLGNPVAQNEPNATVGR